MSNQSEIAVKAMRRAEFLAFKKEQESKLDSMINNHVRSGDGIVASVAAPIHARDKFKPLRGVWEHLITRKDRAGI